MSAKIKEVEVVVDYSAIDIEIDEIYKQIDDKISELEDRVKTLREKEKMLDKFIATAYAQLEATDSKNYKLRTQLQVTISKQLEIQQIVIDTIIKYEKLIQDYMSQKQKIQNEKLSNYLKWKKSTEVNADEAKFIEVLRKFEEAASLMSSTSTPEKSSIPSNPANNEIIKTILQETYEEGFKL